LIRPRGVSLRQQAFRPPCSPPLSLQVRANGLLLGPRSPLSKKVCVRLPIMSLHKQCDWPRSLELVAIVHPSFISAFPQWSRSQEPVACERTLLISLATGLVLLNLLPSHIPSFISAFPQWPRSQEPVACERTLLISLAAGLVLLNLLPSYTLRPSVHLSISSMASFPRTCCLRANPARVLGLVHSNLLPSHETHSSHLTRVLVHMFCVCHFRYMSSPQVRPSNTTGIAVRSSSAVLRPSLRCRSLRQRLDVRRLVEQFR
jgi:hypothetical protein